MPKDPVCNMEVDAGKAASQSEYKGETYYFCSKHCKERFDSGPEAYLSEAGREKQAEPAEPPESSGGFQTCVLPIQGMHCAGCAQTIEKSLNSLEGVREASVNFAAESARVKYHSGKASRNDLVEAVKSSGYEVPAESGMLTLKVTGMSCQSCAQTITKSLNALNGVTEATVNFAAGQASVKYDPEQVTQEDLVKAIKNTGYGVKETEEREADRDESARRMRRAKRRMILAWAITGPIIALMIPHMAGLFEIPGYEWLMVLLAVPVLAASGFNTYRSALKSLSHGTANMDVLIMLGSGAAFLTGPFSLAGLQVFNYAGVGAMIMAFHLPGRFVEAKARGRASRAIRKLLELEAKTARVIRDDEEKEVPVNEVEVEDLMVIRPGEKIPTDGKVAAGTRRLLDDEGIDYSALKQDIAALEDRGRTTVLVAAGGSVLGVIGIADTLKEDSAGAIRELKDMGFQVAMITGDNERTARAVAAQAGIDRVLANVLPDQKTAEIKRLQREVGLVAMVGDGINDAPALTQADVGIALGSGTDIAIESSDITLVRSELCAVLTAVKLSEATFRKIKQNLYWAFGYNLVAIPVAMMGLLHPAIAEAAMAFSSVSVVSNSSLLQKAHIRPRYQTRQ